MNKPCTQCQVAERVFGARCRHCHAKRMQIYRATPIGAAKHRATNDKYKESHPDRAKAWKAVESIKAKPCFECGEPKTHKHHPDTAQPKLIQFLCPLHHKEVHMGRLVLND